VRPRFPFALILVAAACAAPVRSRPAAAVDREAWLQDLGQLEHHLGVAYANLDWNRTHRSLDLFQLSAQTRRQLQEATSDAAAFRALTAFVGAFRDPHLTIAPPEGSLYGRRYKYPVQFSTDGLEVVVERIASDACAARPGDRVLTIQGRPARVSLEENLPLSRTTNVAAARESALRKLTDSWFAPAEAQEFTFSRQDSVTTCRLSPVAPSAPAPQSPVAWTMPGAEACAAMGGDAPSQPFGFPVSNHPQLHVMQDAHNAFAAGQVHLKDGRVLGWLRVPLFDHQAYPLACAEEWDRRRAGQAGVCDGTCQDAFFDALGERLVRDAAARMREFDRAQVSAVVIDVTDNGGGTDWVMDVARAAAPGPLGCPRATGIRHPHWEEHLRTEARELDACDVPGLTKAERAFLDAERAWNAKLLAQSADRCDLSGLFEGGKASCVLGLDARPPAPCDGPIAAAPVPQACKALGRSERAGARGLIHVPLFLLINRNTGSAAEEFAAILKDNGAAALVGEQTVGAGCGYVDHGIPLTLARTGISVRAPDCSRYRRDGTNETEGIQPDIRLDWTRSDLGGRWASYAEKALVEADRLFPLLAVRDAGM